LTTAPLREKRAHNFAASASPRVFLSSRKRTCAESVAHEECRVSTEERL
jgi:hypothetical protein